MKRLALLTLSLMIATPALAAAQGSGSARVPEQSRNTERNFNATSQRVEGRVVQVLGNRLIIEDRRGTRHTFNTESATRFRADRRSLLGDISNPQLIDFVSGTEVKVTYNAETNMASTIEAKRAEERSTKGTVVEVDPDRSILVIETEEGERVAFNTLVSTKFKNDRRSAIGDVDEDDLTVAHYVSGVKVKFKYRVADNGITEIKAER